MEVEVIEGRCTSGGTIAGSTLTLDRGVQNFMRFTGSDLGTAVSAASLNPAKLIGREGTWGTLGPGLAANITVLSADGEVTETFLGGSPVIGSA
jgi:N-acetylglucosamine-6-phosphate deacetylase